MLGLRIYDGNATPGIRHKSPSPGRPDGNGRGTAGLNLPSESGECDSPRQGVKVPKNNSRPLYLSARQLSPCNGCGCYPQAQEHAARLATLALCPSPYPHVEALGASWASAGQLARAVASPYRLLPNTGEVRLQKSQAGCRDGDGRTVSWSKALA